MSKKALLVATVQSHIGQFHKPLMKLLKDNGWEIHVAARDNLAEKDGLSLEYPDKVFDVAFQRSPFDPRNLKAYRMLKKIINDGKYDVIHCNTPVGGLLTRLAARDVRRHGTKVIYTAHGFHFYKGAPLKNWFIYYPIEKWLSRYTDVLVTITEEDFNLAKNKFNCQVFHLHGAGANSSKYHPISSEEIVKQKNDLGLGNDRVILNVGELLPNKNQKAAILAMKRIVGAFPDAHLLIAGDGPSRQKLETLVVEEGLEKHVTFLGYTTKLEKYMQVCDVLLACSYREGLPFNLMESMLCGKPIVASHNRGHNELVHEGENGYLVNPDDYQAYAEKICQIFGGKKNYFDVCLKIGSLYRDINVVEELKFLYGINN